MEVSIKFDLNKEEDRKMYDSYMKMKEITINLEYFKVLLSHSIFYGSQDLNLSSDDLLKTYREKILKANVYFEEMIWKKYN